MRTTKKMAMKMAEAEEHSKKFNNIRCYCLRNIKTGRCYMYTVKYIVDLKAADDCQVYAVYESGKRII